MEYDSVVSSVISAFQKRAEIGQVKYGKTLDRNDLTFLQWIQHAQEELMDGILYLEKIKQLAETQTLVAVREATHTRHDT